MARGGIGNRLKAALFGKRGDATQIRALIAQADAARDRRCFDEAAELYAQIVALAPQNVGMLVQRGHALKEAGRYADAEQAYLAARSRRPDDSDLALQLGHFYKLIDCPDAAEQSYRAALALRPDWADPLDELDALKRRRAADADAAVDPDKAGLLPGLVPAGAAPVCLPEPPALHLHRLGSWDVLAGRRRRVVRGVVAIRGYLVTELPIAELRVSLGRTLLHSGTVSANIPVRAGRDGDRSAYKAVFNLWLDCSALPPGPGTIVLRFIDETGAIHRRAEELIVSTPLDERDYPASDAMVSLDPDDTRSAESQIRSRPSMVRDARRDLFPDGPRSILVLRTDQLGDMVASIPALRRLRALAPQAKIVGLVTSANVDLARTLDLFDEVIEIAFPDSPLERRRVMPFDDQDRLRRRLLPYDFDVAIDLAPSHVSRDLLRLSGARFLHGFASGDEWPWLQGRLEFRTPDPIDERDTAPHSTKMLALVDALGTLIRPAVEVLRRADLPRSIVGAYGIAPQDRFVVLHLGARLAFSRWPHFAELAVRLLRDTDVTVVLMDPDQRGSTLPADLTASPRVRLLTERIPFDHLDALLSHATAMVGNDSGPKHLAALRGTPTVTLFTARIHWSEWGQENVGAIISRRVPCAGCAIFHDVDECGQDFNCIRDIGIGEVFQTLQRYL